ncbi:lysophospholipid acyltransferase family protein [Bifidobacterium choloepi]|uniref:1-acyl-sn-glycerol-3-phosphate acyltransferase n=1 Tax=Bifidobacterium choloepi TaxID=2614131 RepID=A0A6I5NFL5_9BIFI|nr:lysophospholipid acyltransferase family protein [Bifidobacterium choloepi]NEG70134.1 1-acyl-sn-glycerol-3-phosphate acyltransferase [Bifidobacterium choloepi]
MLYWFFVKGLGPIAWKRMDPTPEGLENIPREGGGIIAANHLAVIDDALLPMTCPRMIHFMGKAEYFEGKGIKGKIKKWFFTSVGVFPVDRSGGSKSLGALEHAREIIEEGHLFGIHVEGTRSPDGRLYKGHTGAARLALETGCPIIPTAIIGSRELQMPGQVIPNKGHSRVIYGKPIEVEKVPSEAVTHDMLRELTDRVVREIQKLSGQEYVDEYAQVVKAQIKAEKEAREAAQTARTEEGNEFANE